MKRAVFLDRDGVINKKAPEGDYVTRWEDFEFLPRIAEAITRLNQAGFRVIVITNQRCIAKGLMTSGELETIHQRMVEFLAERGARIDAIYYCPHDVEPSCRCRKPAPGMFFDAARDHGIDLQASWMIGDSDIDIEAGQAAGCKTALLLGKETLEADANRGLVAKSLFEAVRQILYCEQRLEGQTVTVPANSAAVVGRIKSRSRNN